MQTTLEELIMISDILDINGFHKEASDLDEMIKERWEQAGKVPEHSPPREIRWQEAFIYLKQNIASMQPSLTNDVVQQLFNTIDLVANDISIKSTSDGLQERVQAADQVYYLPPEFVTLAENIANFRKEIKQSNDILQDKNTPEDEANKHIEYIKEDTKSLNENIVVLDNKATPEQRAMVMEYVSSIGTGQKILLLPERKL